MMKQLIPEAIAQNPDILTRSLTLPSGEVTTLRVIRSDDWELLGRYFEGLSEATRQLYAPHSFDVETARKICAEIDYADSLRFVVLTRDEAPRIIAYFIVKLGTNEGDRHRYEERGMFLDEVTTCSLAPSVADDYQSQGVGSAMMPAILETVRLLGRQRMVLSGGTRAINHRAIHFYGKVGFRRIGDFESSGNNHDMILDLS